jgi:hypothetical protein
VRQVVLELAQAVGYFADVAIGDADAVVFNAEQGPDAVQLRLNDPAEFILLDLLSFLGIEVLPIAQEHGVDLRRQRSPGVILPPVVIAERCDEALLSSPSRFLGDGDSEGGTFGFQFGQCLHASSVGFSDN